jgi:hypothetical protein
LHMRHFFDLTLENRLIGLNYYFRQVT